MADRDNLTLDPFDCDQQYNRFYHHDLAFSEDSKLAVELWALRPLLLGLPPEIWLFERVQALEGELKKRQWREPEYKIHKPKSKLAEGIKL